MANNSLFNKILASSPYVEYVIRNLYWRNIKLWDTIRLKKKKKQESVVVNSDFEKIKKVLKTYNLEDNIVIVHSSYSTLKKTGLNARILLSELIELVGVNGTLAMPAIRRYPSSDKISTYNTKKSKIWTGALPFLLLRKKGSTVSRHPLNSMVAFGKEASAMMKNNIDEEKPTPNGRRSSWAYCLEKDAFIIGLGIDLTHSLTMIHTAEDLKDHDWPVKDWYRERTFKIVDGTFEIEKTVRERRAKWGKLHFAERTLCKDLIKENIIDSMIVEGVRIEVTRSKKLINFLNARNSKGYPYFGVKSYLK